MSDLETNDDFFSDTDNGEKEKKITAFIGKVKKLDLLPQVAQKIMKLTSDPNAKISDLEKTISSDQAMVSKILMISNSAFYGLEKKVETLRRAIVVLGFRELKDIAISAALLDMYGRANEYDLLNWEHAVGVAIGARLLTLEMADVETEESFLAGLLHDIGKVILMKTNAQEYKKVVEQYYSYPDHKPMLLLEQETFGFNHADVGYYLAKHWNFSENLQHIIGFHHNLSKIYSDKVEERTLWGVAIINLANQICHKLGIGLREAELEVDFISSEANQILKIDAEKEEELMEMVKMRFFEDKAMFS